MVDPDVLLRKTAAIEHHGSRLRAKLPLAALALRRDESLRNDVCFDLLQALQSCMDLAIHVCASEALGVPAGPAEAFRLLHASGVISAELAHRLARAAGLRNLLVHQYGDLDLERLVAALTDGLADLDEFVIAMRSRPGSPAPAQPMPHGP